MRNKKRIKNLKFEMKYEMKFENGLDITGKVFKGNMK